MKKISWIFIVITTLLLLQSCNDSNATTETVEPTTDSTTATIAPSQKEEDTTDKETERPDPYQLFKGELLGFLLENDAAEMSFGTSEEGIEEDLLYTYYDVDGDGDEDLFIQVFFERGEVIIDAFAFYYNNAEPNFDPEFAPGFSSDGYHQLGKLGDPSPCQLCVFQSREDNIFTFRDRSRSGNNAILKYKFVLNKDMAIEWVEQK